ncbi:hypothetical protein C488_07672 [Natrinema pellirubrum DSM 15624]|uniref:Uncharacterized protein n=2 Tax=Natrinema pellirubrum (strain DSM 15624 / CIP 106293 / JCM 10476 / NCIMB 786 / 157) TaxID=797303 RepID=L9YS14_NATP1|nr:hypothetical protein C488_07672 [Natrinema pellirubrum DSM 15624]
MIARDAVLAMSLAAETRRTVDRRPFLRTALRAGVVNYTAAARSLPIEGEADAIATALRRYADELPAHETDSRDVRVRMESGVGRLEEGADRDDALVTVGDAAFGPCGGDSTAIVATGEVDAAATGAALERLDVEGIAPDAAAVADGTMILVVDRRAGATALRAVEDALDRVDVRAD